MSEKWSQSKSAELQTCQVLSQLACSVPLCHSKVRLSYVPFQRAKMETKCSQWEYLIGDVMVATSIFYIQSMAEPQA